jgi:hypothetical protein
MIQPGRVSNTFCPPKFNLDGEQKNRLPLLANQLRASGTHVWYSLKMKPIIWSPDKNRKLIEERNISFENVIFLCNLVDY